MSPTSPRKPFGGGVTAGAPISQQRDDASDFRKIGALVTVVNRFAAHQEGITSILVVSPDNANMGDGALGLDDPVVGHTVLLTTHT
jgi:hypothetical protein